MLIVEVVVAVVVGVFLVGVYRDAKNGTLPLQNSVGIKTPATMSSEDTWNRIHKQYAPIFLVDACALFLIALEIIIGGAMEKSFNNMASEALIALVATLVVMVLANLVVVVVADRSARKCDSLVRSRYVGLAETTNLATG